MNNATTASSQLDAYLDNLGISYNELLYYITHHQMGNFAVIAAGALYAYDFSITFDEEVGFAWSHRKWWQDGPRLVFLLNRYVPFCLIGMGIFFNTSVANIPPFVPSSVACSLPPAILLLSLVNFGAVEVILMLRVWILWEKSRKIGILLSIVFVLSMILALALIRVDITYPFPLAQFPSNILVGCPILDYSTKGAYRGAYIYFMGATLECISFSLLISRVWMDTARRSNPIISALIRHGALYYSVSLFGFILAIISTIRAEFNFPLFRANILIIMCSISCNYLMIGLRRVDGSLAGGVTDFNETWQPRVRNTMDVTTTFANGALAQTRDTDSSPWDVEMSSRSARRSSIDEV